MGGVPNGGIDTEQIPEIGRRRIESDLRQVLIGGLVGRDKVRERELSELLELLAERRAIAVDGVTDPAATRGHLHVGDDTIKQLRTSGRDSDAKEVIRYTNTAGDGSSHRGPVHHVAALLDHILGIHGTDRQRQLRVQPDLTLRGGLLELKCDLVSAEG